MGISELYIIKRDGKRAPFSVEKIKRAISKAFLSVGGYATDDDLTSVLEPRTCPTACRSRRFRTRSRWP